MASDADPAREVLRERMTRQQLCDLSDMFCNAAHLFSRLSNFWEGTACTLAEESEYAHAQLAARTTERDQVAHERDALRAEVEKLRAAPGCGEKVREAVRLWVEQRRLYEDDDASLADWQAVNTKARRALDALTDADLAAPALPDHVRECVEACEEYAQHFDDSQSHSAWMRCVLAGRAARAKGGA